MIIIEHVESLLDKLWYNRNKHQCSNKIHFVVVSLTWNELTSFKMSQFSRPWTINSFFLFNSFTNTFCFVFVTFVNWCDISRQILTWQLLNRLLAPGLKKQSCLKTKIFHTYGKLKMSCFGALLCIYRRLILCSWKFKDKEKSFDVIFS